MTQRVKELCRRLWPVLGKKIDMLWNAYVAEDNHRGKADIEQALEMLASKHLGSSFGIDRSCFVPPDEATASDGDIVLGTVANGKKELYPLKIRSERLKEHILVSGRSGSGKTNLTFVLLEEIMKQGLNVLALDWKRGYRDLLEFWPDMKVYTIGRNISPFKFNPLIPPVGCEPGVWIKLVVDVIASAYLGGEGVISLLIAGIDKLYRDIGIYDGHVDKWPTVKDLLLWLKSTKLKGRAAMWQASAERILLALCYGEFGKVLDCQDNTAIAGLLDDNVIMEMDGLSGNSDRVMFSEALTLYLYRLRLAQGPRKKLTNMIVIEEAHNLLHRKTSDSRESVLESSIRMIRQYGIGYVFVDQSASLLSNVAFANCYLMLALSQKLKADVQAVSGAMNLEDEQKQAINTLERGNAVVRLSDGYCEPFMVKIPLSRVNEGSISDEKIKDKAAGYPINSRSNNTQFNSTEAISAVPASDNNNHDNSINKRNTCHHDYTRPPTPHNQLTQETDANPPGKRMTHEEVRFLADVASRPTLTTVKRYQDLKLSRRRGNAIRQELAHCGIIAPVPIATRSCQIMLYKLTEIGVRVCQFLGIDPGRQNNESMEHRYWVKQAKSYYEGKGYSVTREFALADGKAFDLLAERPGEKIAVEVETGKSDIAANIKKAHNAEIDKLILLAVNPTASVYCQKAIDKYKSNTNFKIEIINWLGIS